MRIIFMGTPDFAVPTLNALADAGHEIVAAYSQPPRRAGRGKALTPSPVQRRAEALGIRVEVPSSLKGEDEQSVFKQFHADVAVVAAYGLILPPAILEAPRLGCLNVHGSLLPRWRGAAPVQRALLAGDAMTGVTIMDMAAGLDTGALRLRVEIPTVGKTAGALSDEIALAGARAMVTVLTNLHAFPPEPQPDDGVTYAAKISKAEALLDFAAGAVMAERQVRAFNPAPGAYFEQNGERIRILAAEVEPVPGEPGLVLDDRLAIGCGADSLRPTLVQRAGRSAMTTGELLRGFPIPAGSRLG